MGVLPACSRHLCSDHRGQERTTGVTDGRKPPCGCYDQLGSAEGAPCAAKPLFRLSNTLSEDSPIPRVFPCQEVWMRMAPKGRAYI